MGVLFALGDKVVLQLTDDGRWRAKDRRWSRRLRRAIKVVLYFSPSGPPRNPATPHPLVAWARAVERALHLILPPREVEGLRLIYTGEVAEVIERFRRETAELPPDAVS